MAELAARETWGRRASRRIALAISFAMLVTAGVLSRPSGVEAAPETLIPGPMLAEFQDAAVKLAQASMLAEMVGVVPGFGESPATLLGLHHVFGGVSALSSSTEQQLADQLDALETLLAVADGDRPALPGIDFSSASVEQSGDVTSLSFDLAIGGARGAELAISTDDAFLVGSDQDLTLTIPATTFTFEYDATEADPSAAFALVEPFPVLSPSITFDSTAITEDVVFGYASAEATGTVVVDIGFGLTVVDPDGVSGITGDEFSTLDIADLVSIDTAPSAPADVTIDLDLEADVFGESFTGTLDLVQPSIFDAPVEPVVGVGGSGAAIDLLTNFSSEAAITALTQLVSSFGAAMIGGDVDLPFLDDGVFIPGDIGDDFDQIFDVIQPLLGYVEPRAAGQIVCGTSAMPPEGAAVAGIPFGQTLFVETGEHVFCRAYTTEDGSGVDWDVDGDATPVGSLTKAGSVGTGPTDNIEFVAGSDGPIEVAVSYTTDGGVDTEILPRPETIQALLAELGESGLIPVGVDGPEFEYDPNLEAITFDIGTTVEGLPKREVSVNVGSELVGQEIVDDSDAAVASGTGMSGLQAAAGASAEIEISDIVAGATLGLILTGDVGDINPGDNTNFEPGPGDRFFLKNTDSMLTVDTVALDGIINMVGRLGFLEIEAALDAVLGPQDGNADPAVTVGLDGNAPPVTIGNEVDTDAVLIVDLLRGGPTGFGLDTNLVLTGDLAVSSTVPGMALAGSLGVEWDLDDDAPTLTDPDLDFTNNLFPFDTAETLTYLGVVDPADESLFDVAAPGGLLAQAGLVGSTLDDGAGNTCTIVAVLTDTTLRCENPMPASEPGMIDMNPITFQVNQPYDVSGNTLAYFSEILAAIDGLAGYIEEAVGTDSFKEPIPVIGVAPADLVGHVAELRAMVDEFRGIQDGVVNCVLTPPPPGGDPGEPAPLDIRAIDVSEYSLDDLDCQVNAPVNGPSEVRFRIVDVQPGADAPGAWIDGDAASVGGMPSATVSPHVGSGLGDLDDDGDGYVSLGSEYTVEAEWVDDGEPQSSALPPRTPQSLGQFEQAVRDVLHLPEGSLQFEFVGAPADPTLRITLGYGICSTTPPSGLEPECTGMPTGPTPTADLNFSLGGSVPDFVGLDTTGSIEVQYAAVGTFSVGVPLNDPLHPRLYGNTGVDLSIGAVSAGPDLSFSASVGPANASLGTAAGISGEADNDNDDDTDDAILLDGDGNLQYVPDGTVVTRGADTCATSAATSGSVGCAIDGGWMNGDVYTIGGIGVIDAGLEFSIAVEDASDNTPLGDDEWLPFDITDLSTSDIDIVVSGFSEVVGGAADCGSIDPSRFQEVEIVGTADANSTLTGLACSVLSMQLTLGSASVYLGELAFEWSAPGVITVYVPADLATALGEALLDPAFLLQALPGLLAEIEDGLRDAANSGLPAAISDPLHLGADGIGGIRVGAETLIDTIGPEILLLGDDAGGLAPLLETKLTELFDIPDTDIPLDLTVTVMCGGVDCDGSHTMLDVDDISAQVTFGGEWTASTGVNLGLEGLPISFEGGIEAFAGFEATLGLGVNFTDGPYLLLNDPTSVDDPDDLLDSTVGAELKLAAGVRFPDDLGATDCEATLAQSVPQVNYDSATCLRGRLVFLFIEALDRTTENEGEASNASAAVTLDITSTDQQVTLGDIASGDLGVEFGAQGNIHLDLHIRTGLDIDGVTDGGDLPTVLGTFLLDWEVAFGDSEIATPTIEFGNLHLDVGTFLAQFINPIAKEIKKITGPLQPIIDVILAPIPVISDLAELVGQPPVTMVSLLEAATGADLSLVRAVAAFITFVNEVGQLDEDDGFQIPLGGFDGGGRAAGDFTVNADIAGTSVAPSAASTLVGGSSANGAGSGFVDDIGAPEKTGLGGQGTAADGRPSTFGVPGLSFPFLEDASQIFGLLVGSDVTLIRWDAGTLEASAGFSYDFGPIMAGPVPITITIGGEIGVRGRFAIGYDTYGIRQLLDGGSGTALFDGIFIDDLDANGNDVAEIEFFGKVFAGASVDLVIVSVGVRGGVELTFSLDLDDRPDPDGKLRILEIVDKLQNPICLFVVSGKIEAFLEIFVEIDLFLWSEEFSIELVRITLLEWSSACEPPTPKLSTDTNGDGVVYLNVGDRRTERNIREDEVHESIEVRQIGEDKVRISGFGWEETRSGVDLIVADAGAGDDELKFLDGTREGTGDDEPPIAEPWRIPVVATGGPGADTIVIEGEPDAGSVDRVIGDAAIDGTSWQGVAYSAPPTEPGSDDEDYEGDDGDSLNAGPGDDLIEAGSGDDTADGQFGDDTVLGGPGADDLDGGPGSDVVDGGADNDTVQGGPIEQPAPDATNAEIDDDDVLIGGTGRDVASGDFGNDTVFGDVAPGDALADLTGTTDGRRRLAGAPAPVAVATFDAWCAAPGGGTDGDDLLTGTDGDDVLVGGGGDDSIDGGNGNDLECGGPGDDDVIGGDGDDDLRGDGDDDDLEGNDGNDRIDGGAGDDVAHGNDGDDDIFGGTGSDLLYGDADDDVVVGDTGTLGIHVHGIDDGSGQVATAAVTGLDTALAESTGGTGGLRACDSGTGVGDSDCVYGGTGSDALFGGDDADTIRGESGVDLIVGNSGDDDIRGGGADDLLFGSAGSDTIFGDSGDDEALGDRSIADWAVDAPSSGSRDDIYGGPGADHLEGDGGDDFIFGGADRDHIEGNNGTDTIRGEAGDDDLIGGSDAAFDDAGDTGDVSDFIYGSLGEDVIAGDNAEITPLMNGHVLGRSVTLLDVDANPAVGGGDTMEGDADTDAIFGQAGDDTIHGDLGQAGPSVGSGAADYIEGNAGQDTVYGEVGDDDIIGGGSAGDGAVVPGRNGTGLDDAGEVILVGGPGRDWIAGDNALMDRVIDNGIDYPSAVVNPIRLFDLGTVGSPADPTSYGSDEIHGNEDSDLIFGQGGDDDLFGEQGADYVEGNDGVDEIVGDLLGVDEGGDDLVGGGSANDGVIDRTRDGSGLLDAGEQVLSGGGLRDWIAGDNARLNRVLFATADYPDDSDPLSFDPIVLFDLQRSAFDDGAPAEASDAALVADAGTYGDDVASGGGGSDLMFGQGGSDTLDGDGDGDYIEGNDGNDGISGGDGNDDIVGGGSARDGVVDRSRIGEGLHDEGETFVEGNAGVDWIMGDNAFSNRVLFPADGSPIDLFDVNSPDTDVSGGDIIDGGTEDDLIFGQGNGVQGDQSDPADGMDNDGDGAVDEDAGGWLGDTIFGSDGQDYIEGNHGADLIVAGAGNDDVVGGGSAIDGVIDDDRIGDGLLDARDTILGGDDADVLAGDNTRILPAAEGPLWLLDARDVKMFDVNSTDAMVSGGDFIAGEGGDDVIFGQGNGDQSPDQADPLDGFDNDLDGRESPGSAEYDCFDGFDNDGDGLLDVDGAGVGAVDPECVDDVDEDQPWDGDIIIGGDGDDYAEGNHGADWMFGGNDQDDLIGGGSADDGHITEDRNPEGLHDRADVIHGEDHNDVITGDNGRINRTASGTEWAHIPNATSGYSIVDRDVAMVTSPDAAGTYGDDHLLGGALHDQIYGQQGHDLIQGNHGDDAVIGDLGKFVTRVSVGEPTHIEPKQPFVEDDVFGLGTLYHLTTLFSQESGDGAEGDDIILGGQGHDDLHGGPGDDIINGDRFDDVLDTSPPPDPDLIELIPGQFTWDDPTIGQAPFANEDAVFGGWGDDVLWGGRDPDHLYGGHGEDFLDVRPRPASTELGTPRDPAAWFTWVRAFDPVTSAYTEEHYQDSDTVYGGWGQDVLQANLADTGPNDGDRLFDWVGAYNLFLICPPVYGDWVATRALAPGMLRYFNDLGEGDGLEDPTNENASGYSELGLVYTRDVKQNANPPHPDTPGHFYCGDGIQSGGGGKGGGAGTGKKP